MMSTDAKRAGNKRYLQERVEDIRIRVTKGDKPKIKAAADRHGLSLNAYIVEAIESRMGKEGNTE